MADVYPDLEGLNRIKRKHALNEELHRLQDASGHMERVLTADKEVLQRHKARMERHKAEVDRLHREARRIRDRIRDLEAQDEHGVGALQS
jgi:predicted  nucleic acid-binding Zn-ribbon protein